MNCGLSVSYGLKALKPLYFHFARFYEKKKYLEPQALGRRKVCPIGPANQHIIM